MNFRSTYILLGTVFLALVVLGIYVLRTGDDAPSPLTEGYLLRPFKAANVTAEKVSAVEIEYPGQTPELITFVREEKGGGWKMTHPTPGRADAATLEGIVNALLNAKTDKTADISPNLAAQGLENPGVKITLKSGTLSETVSFGDVLIGGDRAVVYVMTTDRPGKAQAAKRNDFQALFKGEISKGGPASQFVKSLSDFRPLRLLGDGIMDAGNQVRSFRIIDGKDEMAIFRTTDNVWKFRLPADFGDAEADSDAPVAKDNKVQVTNVRQLLNEIMNIRPGDAKQVLEKPGDLAKYGLDPAKSKPMQIDFSRDDGIQETLFVGDVVKVENTDRYYARHQGDNMVAEVNATAVRTVREAMKAKYLLRDRTVGKFLAPRVDAIDVETNGEKFELRQIAGQWKVFDSEGLSRPAKRFLIEELMSALAKKSLATGFPNADIPEDRRGFVKPVVEIKVWESGIVKDDKQDPNAKPKVTAPPTIRFQFGNKDVGDVVFLRRLVGEAKADFYVPLTALTVVERPRLDYIDTSFKSFDIEPVLKFSFTSGKDLVELERPADGKPAREAAWKITGPDSLKGRPVDAGKVADLIMSVALTRPLKIAADRPKDDVLNRLQLDPKSPRAKATVSHKDLGNIVYDFGADAGTDKRNVYLKTGVENIIYEVDRGVYDKLQKGDIQDTVIHRIDQAKVKSLKIKGWQATVGELKTLEFERKEGKWTLKSGGMFEIDPKKVDQFIGDLATPQSEKAVVLKTGAKPEHNFDPAKNALDVEMDVEGTGKVTIQISPPDAMLKVFVTSSLAPGDVYLMADKFGWMRDKPTAFK
ncbi:DUF4340 domain-containing protein [Zavarzinella formosa]|uniref:DUF4340 domain-containing protein n=1 Tax=Zavarzinella formosa TaxID=360055 RepID=UPI0002D7D0E2|nr:DUF4340 domain-containing protein [Zavarzinella formosa]